MLVKQWNSTPFLTLDFRQAASRRLSVRAVLWWLVVGQLLKFKTPWNTEHFRWIWRVNHKKVGIITLFFLLLEFPCLYLIQLLWPGSNDGWLQDIQTRPVLLASTRDSNIRHSPMSCGCEDHRRADVSLCEGGPCYWNHDGMSITL